MWRPDTRISVSTDITSEIVTALERNGLLDNTLIVFTSDNGPFFEGSTAGLKGGKGNTWEGGYRVPFILSWPAVIKEGRAVEAIATNIDILPTIADLLDLQPHAEIIDGKSLRPLIDGDTAMQHRFIYYFNNEAVVGLRDRSWKYLTHTYYTGSIGAFEKFDQLPGFESSYDMLFDARGVDGESYSLADQYPEILAQMKRHLAGARKEFDAMRTRPAEATYPQ